jgi:hypothetical protein
MLRVFLVLALVATTLVMASGLALAVTKIATNGPETLRGTNRDDNLIGKGDDVLFGLVGWKRRSSGRGGQGLGFRRQRRTRR